MGTIICYNKKIIDDSKYISRAERIKNFRKREKINMDRDEDLSRALVPYIWKKNDKNNSNRIKRPRVVLKVLNLSIQKKTNVETQNKVFIIVWKENGCINKIREDPKYISKQKKIEIFRNRNRLIKEIKENLSKAMVKYIHKRGRDYNKTARIKRTYSRIDMDIFINFKKRRVEKYSVKTVVIYI